MKPIITLFLLFFPTAGFITAKNPGHQKVIPVIQDALRPAMSAVVRGYAASKLDSSYSNRILAQDADKLVSPFRNRSEKSCWQSEFWGKWMTSAVLAYRYRPEPQLRQKLGKAVSDLIATQSPDGYIGNYADDRHLESWDIWGRKYCMLGLIAYADITGDARSLAAAEKAADHLIAELASRHVRITDKGNHRGMAASSVLEPVCQLYSRTGEKKYLDFAREIVRDWETTGGPQLISKAGIDVSMRFPKPGSWYGPEQGQKAYEMMSCYEGLLELYRLTGQKEYREAVEKTWSNIREKEINIAGSGSSMECWFGGQALQTLPITHYQETCVTVTWIKLCQQLLRLTGESKYADAIEESWYNALLAAMKNDGSDWAKYTPLQGQRMEGSEQCGMGLNCCVASGPRGLFTFPLTAAMESDEGLRINFFAQGTFTLFSPLRQKVTLEQNTGYPVTGNIKITLTIPEPELMTISIRIPGWSKENSLTVNGEPVIGIRSGSLASIRRSWKKGDVITLETDMRGRLVKLGNLPENIAIVRGPVVLARDMRLGGPPIGSFLTPQPGKDGYLPLEQTVSHDKSILMTFKAPFKTESYRESGNAAIQVMLCDYPSAGNTIDERSLFRVWFPQLIDPSR